MLYSEFVSGTGCRENEHNYKVYRDLEIMYMESDMSKEEIYEYGKKLVDNAEPKEIQELRSELKRELADLKESVKNRKVTIEHYTWCLTRPIEDVERRNIKMDMDWHKKLMQESQARIKEIRFVLG